MLDYVDIVAIQVYNINYEQHGRATEKNKRLWERGDELFV